MPQQTYEIDPIHSSAYFSVRHMMVSNVRGQFTKVSGTSKFDSTDPANCSVEATIDAVSIYTHDSQRDTHLKSGDFLDVEKVPTLTFRSKRIESHSGGIERPHAYPYPRFDSRRAQMRKQEHIG